MEVERGTTVWLTAREVATAVRNYAKTAGYKVSPCATVLGLQDLAEGKHVVSVVISHDVEKIQKGHVT